MDSLAIRKNCKILVKMKRSSTSLESKKKKSKIKQWWYIHLLNRLEEIKNIDNVLLCQNYTEMDIPYAVGER